MSRQNAETGAIMNIFNLLRTAIELNLFDTFARKSADEKLLSKLRTQIHTIEKHTKVENKISFKALLQAKYNYDEALKRNLISDEEKKWCEHVLFAKHLDNVTPTAVKKGNGSLYEVIRNRRSIRRWKNSDVMSNEDFDNLVDNARWAPSSCNRQPWHFLLVRDQGEISYLGELRRQKFVRNAPNCIVVLMNKDAYKDNSEYYTMYMDAGAAIQNLLLAAEAMGYGACWVNFGELEVAREKKYEVKKKFHIPDQYEIVSIIPIGKGKTHQHAPARKGVSALVHSDSFKK